MALHVSIIQIQQLSTFRSSHFIYLPLLFMIYLISETHIVSSNFCLKSNTLRKRERRCVGACSKGSGKKCIRLLSDYPQCVGMRQLRVRQEDKILIFYFILLCSWFVVLTTSYITFATIDKIFNEKKESILYKELNKITNIIVFINFSAQRRNLIQHLGMAFVIFSVSYHIRYKQSITPVLVHMLSM